MTQHTVATLLLLFLASGCGARTAVVTWPYTSWYSKRGTGESDRVFERDRKQCIEETGLLGTAESIPPESPEEAEFVDCMNDAGWCTHLLQCRGVKTTGASPP